MTMLNVRAKAIEENSGETRCNTRSFLAITSALALGFGLACFSPFVAQAQAAAPPAPTVTVGTAVRALDGTNVYRGTDELILYTRTATQTITPTNIYGAEIVVTSGKVASVTDRRVTRAAGTAIPVGSSVLSGHATSANWLTANARVGLQVSLPSDSPAWGPYGALGSYKPDAAHSGVPSGIALTPLNGDQIITVAGTVIEGKEVFGNILIRAANVTIRNSKIWGTSGVPTTSGGIINCGSSASTNTVIEDSTIRPQRPSYLLDGVQGHDYTVRRSDISGTVDGFGVMNISSPTSPANVHLEANYVHGLAYRASALQSDGHTHNDGVQIHGNGSVWIQGNNIQAFTDPAVSDMVNPYASTGNQVTGQAIVLTPLLGSISNVHVLGNWIDGGAEGGFHAVPKDKPVSNIGEVKGNKFGTNQRSIKGVRYTVRVAAVLTVDCPATGSSANVFEATGLPVTIVRD